METPVQRMIRKSGELILFQRLSPQEKQMWECLIEEITHYEQEYLNSNQCQQEKELQKARLDVKRLQWLLSVVADQYREKQ